MASPARPTRRLPLGLFAGQPLEDRIVPTFGTTGLLSPVAAGADPVAAVGAGPRLLAADTADSALLGGLLTALAGPGSSVALTAVDYEALSNGSVNLGSLLGQLQTTVGAGSPAAALTADATLSQLLSAAASAARADGNTALATVLGSSARAVGASAGSVRLGDLLNVSLPATSFAQAEVNALDLLVGSVQLFNYRNAGTVAAAVSLPTAALAPLGGSVLSVGVQARVVEPPVFVVGPAGSQFHSAAVRLKLDVDLADVSLDTAGLLAPIRAVVGNAATVTATATVGRLQLYADVARGSGSIQAIDALTNAVTLRSTPAVADVYLGTIADGVFADRTRGIDPARDLTPGVVGSLAVSARVLGVPVLDLSLGLTARGAAAGAAVTPFVTTFRPAYPQTATVGGSAAVIGDLVATLANNLQIGLSGDLGLLTPQAGAVTGALSGAAAGQLRPALRTLLGGTLDPALNTLGIGVGELDLIVLGADSPDAPAAADDTATTTVGRPVTVAVRANDVVQAGTTPTEAVTAAPQHGTAVVNADGTITYTPAAGYLGADSFSYTLTDAFGRTTTATVRVQVNRGANTPPVVRPDAVTTPAGTAVTAAVLANDTDADGDPLTATVTAAPQHGTATVNADGSITYIPATGYVGADSFTYRAADGFGGSGTAVVSVLVGRGPNRTPVTQPDAAATTAGVAVTFDVRTNDADADGDTLAVAALTAPAHGAAVVNADGTITYTPAAGYVGTDTFGYTVADGFGGTAAGVVTVTVGRGPNAPPIARPDVLVTTAGVAATLDVRTNDTDADGDALTVTAVTTPEHGTAVANPNGTVTYTPAAGFRGVDRFSYSAADGFGGRGSATVTVVVGAAGGNTSPVARPDTLETTAGVAATLDVRANDSDADGDLLTVQVATPPAHGTVAVNPDGTVTYTPAAGYVGADTFVYVLTDGFGGRATGAVAVRVGRGPNAPPVATPDAPTTTGGTPVTVPVLANDTDPDGDPVTVTAVSPPASGTAVVNPDGTVTYTPAAGYVGTDTFTYTATDGVGGTTTGTVTATVGRPPAAPAGPPAGPAPGGADGSGGRATDRVRRPYAVGADTTGGPRVTVYNPDGSQRFNFFAYDPNGRFGVAVDMADVTGDGVMDIVTGPQLGGGPHVRVFDGVTLEPVYNFFAFDQDFRGGVSVAAADVDGDGRADVIVGAGVGGGPRVRVFSGRDGSVLNDFFAFDPTYRDGVVVAAADFNGDGKADLIAATGGGPEVASTRGFDLGTGQVVYEVPPFQPGYVGAVNVAVGDVTGDGTPDVVFGAGPGAGPRVRVIDGKTVQTIDDRFVYEESFTGGVRVAVADLDGDGRAEVLTGAGVGGGPRQQVREVGADASMDRFVFEPDFRGGLRVG